MLRRSTEKKEKKKNIRLFHKRGDVLEILSSPLLSIKQLRAHGARDEKRLPVFRARVQQKELYVARVSSTVFIFYYAISFLFRRVDEIFIHNLSRK